MAQPWARAILKTYKNLYQSIISFENLILAWKKARKGKTSKRYVIEFEKELFCNLLALHYELKFGTYKPKPLKTFILRDPKTRKINKSDFIDRIVHHAVVSILEPIFDKLFIYDSCANRVGKGNLFALKRFDLFKRRVSNNGLTVKNNFRNKNYIAGYCLKADIKHYFQEVDLDILLSLIERKISDNEVIGLLRKILANKSDSENYEIRFANILGKGMPLGNLTSQFFANVYLNELDYFVKHELKSKYYIRYVDDFAILHESKEQLYEWKNKIDSSLINKLRIRLHKDKSRIIPLSKGIDFVGFRNFFHFKLLRKRNVQKMLNKIEQYKNGDLTYKEIMTSFQGWQAYSKWANCFEVRKSILKKIYSIRKSRPKDIGDIDKYL